MVGSNQADEDTATPKFSSYFDDIKDILFDVAKDKHETYPIDYEINKWNPQEARWDEEAKR